MISQPAFLRLAIGGREIVRSRVALTLWERFRGLMLAPPLLPGEALWLPACAAVHTAFLRQTIDLVFLSGRQIVRVRPRVPPWSIILSPGADSVIEMAAGESARLGLTAGQSLEVHPDPVLMRSVL